VNMMHDNTKRLLLSLATGILLTSFLYTLSYVLSRYEGILQGIGYLIAMLLAFPLFMFFHEREPPMIILIAVVLFDVIVLSLPAVIFLSARRK
jgi:hypothetical protein